MCEGGSSAAAGNAILRVPVMDMSMFGDTDDPMYAYGTREDIDGFVQRRMRSLAKDGKPPADDPLVSAWREWLDGDGEPVPVPPSGMPIGGEVAVIRQSITRITKEGMLWRFPDGWDCHIDAADISVQTIWVEDGGRTVRAVRVSIGEMAVDGNPVTDEYGDPGLIVTDGRGWVGMTLYVTDNPYLSDEQAMESSKREYLPIIVPMLAMLAPAAIGTAEGA